MPLPNIVFACVGKNIKQFFKRYRPVRVAQVVDKAHRLGTQQHVQLLIIVHQLVHVVQVFAAVLNQLPNARGIIHRLVFQSTKAIVQHTVVNVQLIVLYLHSAQFVFGHFYALFARLLHLYAFLQHLAYLAYHLVKRLKLHRFAAMPVNRLDDTGYGVEFGLCLFGVHQHLIYILNPFHIDAVGYVMAIEQHIIGRDDKQQKQDKHNDADGFVGLRLLHAHHVSIERIVGRKGLKKLCVHLVVITIQVPFVQGQCRDGTFVAYVEYDAEIGFQAIVQPLYLRWLVHRFRISHHQVFSVRSFQPI